MMREELERQQKKVEACMNKAIVERINVDENDSNFIYHVPACYVNWEQPSSIKNWKSTEQKIIMVIEGPYIYIRPFCV